VKRWLVTRDLALVLGAFWLSSGAALAQNAPNAAVALPPNTTIQLCDPAPTNCFTVNASGVSGISSDGSVIGGFNQIEGGAPAPSYFPFAATIHKDGQWFNLAPAVNAAIGVAQGGSYVQAVSGDGNVVTGLGANFNVFRWSFTGPGPGQGTVFILPKPVSEQLALGATPDLFGFGSQLFSSGSISRDGTTIVGTRTGASGFASAFSCVGNCTSLFIVPELGPLGSVGQYGMATNADGSVIVGISRPGVGSPVAFYWSAASSIVDMGTLPGFTGAAVPFATNDVGNIIVGFAQTAPLSFDTHATIWTRGGTLAAPTFTVTDIHAPVLGTASRALAVDAAGTVVVGFSNEGAFRWSAATGSQLLSTVLAANGVSLPGNIVLGEANAVSANGEIIAVNAINTTTGTRLAYVLRYVAPVVPPVTPPVTTPVTPPVTPPVVTPPIVGVTTRESVQTSFDRLADTRTAQMVTTRVMASVLLGINEQVNCGDCFSGFGSVGSFSAGLHGRRSITESVIMMGGVSFNQSQGKGYKTQSSPTFGVQLRLDPADWGPARPFADVGAILAPNAVTRYSRRYDNGASGALGRAGSQSATASVFGRLGYVWRFSKEQEAAVYGEVSQMWQRVKGYQEPLSQANPFEATVAKGTDRMTTVKVGVQFTQLLAAQWELNLSGGVAHGFNRKTETAGAVPGFGLVSARATASLTWGEYGARLSYRVSQGFVIDGFVNGTVSAERAIGNTIHGGFGLRLSF
jgi:probable HAF family extracellular repeat protein